MKKLLAILITILCLSSNFKLSAILGHFDFPIKYILTVLLIFLIILNHTSFKLRINREIIIILFLNYFWSVISLFYVIVTNTETVLYSSLIKILDVSLLQIIFFCSIIIIQNMEISSYFKVQGYTFYFISLIYMYPIMLSILMGADRALTTVGGPNIITRILYITCCFSLYFYKLYNKNIHMLLFFIFILGIIFIGSRGGMVGLIVTSLIYIFLNKNILNINIKKLFVTSSFMFVIYFIFKDFIKHVFLQRFIYTTFQSDGKIYTAGRNILYKEAWSLIKEHPIIGNGTNAFFFSTRELYPHNMFLELWLELGVFGLCIYVILLYFAIKVLHTYKNTIYSSLSLIPFYIIVVQLFSGSYYDFRFYFLFLSPFLLIKTKSRSELL